jgi:hypothetical protein
MSVEPFIMMLSLLLTIWPFAFLVITAAQCYRLAVPTSMRGGLRQLMPPVASYLVMTSTER